MSIPSPTKGTHRPTTPPKVPEVAKGFINVGAQVAPIVRGKTARKNCDATEVPTVKFPILVPVESMFDPAATNPAPPAAVPAEPLAQSTSAFPNFFHG
jgi:hypothetical protein